MLTVHLRINDSDTKQPTAVRLRVTGPNGEYFAPLGRLTQFTCGTAEDVGANLRLDRESSCPRIMDPRNGFDFPSHLIAPKRVRGSDF